MVSYQVLTIADVANGLLMYVAHAFLLAGSIFGLTLVPETYNILLFVLPPGAFITLGFLIAIVNKLRNA